MFADDNISDDVFEDAETTARKRQTKKDDEYYFYPTSKTLDVDSETDYRTPSPSGYPGYKPPKEALQMYGLQADVSGIDDQNFEKYSQDCEGWKSYKYEEEEDASTMTHKTILLGDSGVGKTSFLVKYNTGEFKAGNFSATVGIALTVMLLGDSGVGKTCLLVRFRDGTFLSGNFISTVGIDFRNKIVIVDHTRVKLQIWDTAGQERFRSVTHAYYRDAHALLLLYDVANKTSFDNIRAWLGEIREYAQEDVVIMLLGNKADCGYERQVRREDGERLAKEYNVPFMETSAKTGLNVEVAFLAVARQLKSRRSDSVDDAKFNVQDFVREQTHKPTCPPCNM